MGQSNDGDAAPRLPRTVQGLLGWAQQVQGENRTDGPLQPMDAERAKWLEEALKAMTVDEVQQIKEALSVLSDATDASAILVALDNLHLIVENLDSANDLQLLGGWPSVSRLLSHSDASVRAKAAEVIATSVQNYPKAQAFALDSGTIPALLSLASDADAGCRKKAVLGLSALVRGFEPAEAAWEAQGGVEVLAHLLADRDTGVLTKSLFFLVHVCAFQPKVKDAVREAQALPTIASLVAHDNAQLREVALAALVELCTGAERNVQECRKEDVGLVRQIAALKKEAEKCSAEEKEERREEIEHINRLAQILA